MASLLASPQLCIAQSTGFIERGEKAQDRISQSKFIGSNGIFDLQWAKRKYAPKANTQSSLTYGIYVSRSWTDRWPVNLLRFSNSPPQ